MVRIHNLLVYVCSRDLLWSVFILTGCLLIGHISIGRMVRPHLVSVIVSLVLKGGQPHSNFVTVLLFIPAQHVFAKFGLVQSFSKLSRLNWQCTF